MHKIVLCFYQQLFCLKAFMTVIYKKSYIWLHIFVNLFVCLNLKTYFVTQCYRFFSLCISKSRDCKPSHLARTARQILFFLPLQTFFYFFVVFVVKYLLIPIFQLIFVPFPFHSGSQRFIFCFYVYFCKSIFLIKYILIFPFVPSNVFLF